MSLGRTGFIGRFKPLHLGAALALETLCQQSDHVIIGIGSSNKYNARSPFTAEESEDMINAVLAEYSNYEIVKIPDFAQEAKYSDGNKWKSYMIQEFGTLDHFVSGNTYVSDLLSTHYDVIHPASLIPPDEQIPIRATEVRIKMAQNTVWQSLVPEIVVDYLENNNLVERFRNEFGLETLTHLINHPDYLTDESTLAEKLHTTET
jgi:nicotinamide mononucleotide adenylyltransferase